MSYLSKVIVSGERVQYEAHFHWIDKLGALILCGIGIGIFWVIAMWSTEMAITNRRVIYKRGWIARRTEEMSLHRIEEVNLRQSILGRIFGYGKVQVRGMGGSGITFPALLNIGSPLRFKQQLDEAKAQAEAARD